MTFDIPTPERSQKTPEELIADAAKKVMTYRELREKGRDAKRVFEFSRGDRELLFFGFKHSNDPENPMFDELKRRFEKFCLVRGEKPLVMIEGRA